MGACAAKQPPARPVEATSAAQQELALTLLHQRRGHARGEEADADKAALVKEDIQLLRIPPGGIGPSRFIHERLEDVEEVYTLEQKLGLGSYGCVYRATHKATGVARAVKAISKGRMSCVARIKKEAEIMKILDHPNVVRLFESFEDKGKFYLAMELCAGGELLDRVLEEGAFSEAKAASVVQQTARAAFYMHSRHVCHRDIKPENMLFETKGPVESATLKLADFGTSCVFESGVAMRSRVGSVMYLAPQVLAGQYDQSCDVWSLGVVSYILLCGYPPFGGRSEHVILAKVKLGSFSFADGWECVSKEAKQFVRSLLRKDPKDRLTAEGAQDHPWLQHQAPRSHDPLCTEALGRRLSDFRRRTRFQKAALQVVARQMDNEQIGALRSAFTALDVNGDGMLSLAEIKTGLDSAGILESAEEVAEVLGAVDTDSSGQVDYTEFLAAALERGQYLQEDICRRAFGVFDLDGDGKISAEELECIMNGAGMSRETSSGSSQSPISQAMVAGMVQEADRNGDGAIDFQEFVATLQDI